MPGISAKVETLQKLQELQLKLSQATVNPSDFTPIECIDSQIQFGGVVRTGMVWSPM